MLITFEISNDGEFRCARGIEVGTPGRSCDDRIENICGAVGLHRNL
jgi:hypothetical protein